MAAKALLFIDMEIARLRSECDEATENIAATFRLEELLNKRDDMLQQMLAERTSFAIYRK